MQIADKFVKGKALGEGTWGQVYEAYTQDNTVPYNRVAIKRMRGIGLYHLYKISSYLPFLLIE
jgi:hypothetical protein